MGFGGLLGFVISLVSICLRNFTQFYFILPERVQGVRRGGKEMFSTLYWTILGVWPMGEDLQVYGQHTTLRAI